MSEFEQKVLKLLEEINSKLDKVLKAEPIAESSAPVASNTSTTAATTVKPSAIVDKQEEEARLEEKPQVEGRRICPECASTAFATHEDRSQVLHQMGGVKIYAKYFAKV